MSTALYRRYRPDSFAEMIGQEHVTGPLMQALRSNRVNHAYLFSGPRGCGKTTSARILARILNCAQNTEGSPTDTPCGECPSCVELARGGSGSLDVVEIDAASHGGVDDARDLRERATFSPTRDRFKIFILDEAHMVTAQGFNALLKIVEEPPSYLKFIFATTEPEKVIGTIRSRTHHYPFKLVAPETMHNYLVELCTAEGITAAEGVLQLVVRSGGGSVRDTLSVLDQLIAGAAGGVLEYDQAAALLGFTPSTLLDEVVESLGSRNGGQLFRVIDQIISTGHEPRRFVEDLLERLRDLLVLSLSGEAASNLLPSMPTDQLVRMQAQAGSLGVAELSRSADVVNTALTEMSGATSPRLHLELLCARLLLPAADSSASGLGARIDGIERALSSGTAIAGSTGAAPPVIEQGLPAAGQVAQAPAVAIAPSAPAAPVPAANASVADAGGPRKSLRPESTRRKAADSAPAAPTQQNTPMAPGSMFASPGSTTGIFGTPAPTGHEPAPTGHELAPQGPSIPAEVSHQQTAPQVQPIRPIPHTEPEIPANVGQYAGPRDEEGRPLAANTGWHTASSRSPQAPTQPLQAQAQAPTQPVQAQTAPTTVTPVQPVAEPSAQPEPVAPLQTAQTVQVPAPSAMSQEASPTATPAQAGGNETEAFKLRWPEVLETMSGLNRATTALVSQHAQVIHLDSQSLYIAVATEPLLRTLSGRNGEQLIAAAVKEKLGFEVNVLADVEGSPRLPKGVSSPVSAVAATAPQSSAPRPNTINSASDSAARSQSPISSPAPAVSSFPAEHTEHTEPMEPSFDDPFASQHHEPLPPLPSTQWERSETVPESEWNTAPQGIVQTTGPQSTGLQPAASQPANAPVVGDSSPISARSAQEPVEPTPATADQSAYDPMESVSIFGAAIGALANARSVAAPELPRIGQAAAQVTETIRRGPAPLPTSAPEPEPYPESPSSPIQDSPVSAPSPVESWAEPEQSTYGEPAASAEPAAAATIPPWEDGPSGAPGVDGETPRQAAARRAAELAAREAKRAVVVDDPQPDDEDLDTNNLVGVPLVMSMFGAKIIEETTNA